MFFTTPTQVKFYDSTNKKYLGGIAYKNKIICGCCGSAFEVSYIIKKAEEDGIKDPIIELPWIDIQSEILGE